MRIYKILRAPEWEAFDNAGEFSGSPVDLADGFVHLSAPHQVAATAAKHFAGAEELRLIALDAAALGGDLVWEPSRGGDLFPHLYRALRRSDIVSNQPLPLAGGVHVFPPGVLP